MTISVPNRASYEVVVPYHSANPTQACCQASHLESATSQTKIYEEHCSLNAN